MHPANENTKLDVTAAARAAHSSFHQGKYKQMSNANTSEAKGDCQTGMLITRSV